MSDVLDGLTTGEDPSAGLDVDTDAGFMAAVGKAAGVEVPGETLDALKEGSTDIESGLTTEEESASAQPRDDLGRFAPAAQPEEAEEGAAPESEEGALDPAVADYISRHGGNKDAALAALIQEQRDAQAFSGKQSNEVGELREKLARLEGRLDAQPAQQAPPPPSVGEIREYVEENGGPAAIMRLAEVGYPDGHPSFDHAFEAWIAEDDTGQAQAAYTRYLVSVRQPAAAPAATSEPDPYLQTIKLNDSLAAAVNGLKKSVGEQEWGVIRPHLEGALQRAPEAIKEMVIAPDPEVQAAGMSILADMARGAASRGATTAATAARQAEVAETKKLASFASGGARPTKASGAPVGETTREEALDRFRAQILATETTSVLDGLTTG